MLLYKAWRESRLGFLLSVGALAVFASVYLLFPRHDLLQRYTYTQEVYLLSYRGALRNIFIVLTLFLGLGGLRRERANGTVLFTLSLPVSRLKITAARAIVGLIELAVLALVQAIVIPIFSAWDHQPYPSFSQAFHFSLLWMGCGTALLAFGMLLSTIIRLSAAKCRTSCRVLPDAGSVFASSDTNSFSCDHRIRRLVSVAA